MEAPVRERGPFTMDAERLSGLPAEVALRVLGRAIVQAGDEGPLQLGKLEALHVALRAAMVDKVRLRRTLAGALVTHSGGRISVETAPPRSKNRGRRALTTRLHGARGGSDLIDTQGLVPFNRKHQQAEQRLKTGRARWVVWSAQAGDRNIG